MSAPQTPFELTGSFTSLPTETSFLAELHGVGGMNVETLGLTPNGNPIWGCTIGEGTSTVLIVALQHGTERATREATHQLLRDLAYRTEPWMDGYLASHRVAVVPNMNADGFEEGTYDLPTGGNTNRDWIELREVETRIVQAFITRLDPDIVLDAHETRSDPDGDDDWRPHPDGYPGTNSQLKMLATEWVQGITAELADSGFTTRRYPLNSIPWAALSTSSGAAGRVGILGETSLTYVAPARRVAINIQTFHNLLEWHGAFATQIVEARAAARVAVSSSPLATPVPTQRYVGGDPQAPTHAVGYILEEPLPQHVVEAFNIVVQNGFVSLRQPARLIIAALCDPNSFNRLVDASPVFQASAESSPSGLVVDTGDVRYPVQSVVTQQGDVRYPVQSVVIQQGGVRYPL